MKKVVTEKEKKNYFSADTMLVSDIASNFSRFQHEQVEDRDASGITKLSFGE